MNKQWNINFRKALKRDPMWIEIMPNDLARDHLTKHPGDKLICYWCGRDTFTAPSPHKCNTGFRKRNLRWYTKNPIV